MARRRRSDRHEDRDTTDHRIASEAGPQALHRAVVRASNDLRQFHPQKEIIHAVQKRDARLVLARHPTRSNRVHKKLSALRPRPAKLRVPNLRRADVFGLRKTKKRRTISPIRKDLRVLLPKNVAICVRRNVRREVLFARGKGGSRKITRRRHRNQFSNIRCK